MSEVVNLTPHPIRVADKDGNIVAVFPPSGLVARVATTAEVVAHIGDIPVVRTTFGEVAGVPDPKDGVVYIASTLVAQALRRRDVVSPDTGPTALREGGQVVAVRGFQTFA